MITEFAYNVLRTLRVSSITEVVNRLWPLFHKDPILTFPSEIMSQIFSYLTPKMLFEASKVSRAWRERVLDNGLWKRKFNNEGWMLNAAEIQSFEENYNTADDMDPLMVTDLEESGKQRRPIRGYGKRTANPSRGRKSQITPTPCRTQERAKFRSPATPQDIFSFNHAEAEHQQEIGLGQEMQDVEMASPVPLGRQNDSIHEATSMRNVLRARDLRDPDEVASDMSDRYRSPFSEDMAAQMLPEVPAHLEDPLTWGARGNAKLNYHHLFKQKRKLEHNWDTGQYKSFQLPHCDHPEDAHTECVYTIQYSGKHLVSGSRDRTLRIWDLDTQRLIREPLQGHTGSVLCLQFDDRKEEDLIVSGSSDESVILWKFSTGQMIKRLAHAHRESVLNLKFDKRFLVTCSKDKTIKIWNRHELRPGDRDYPVKGVSGGGQCPHYIIDMCNLSAALREPYLFPDKLMLLEPYTHLMTLELHGAAVNAIQIYKDELVSASGDRMIRVWNIHTGESPTKMEAHTKGIACVQYDGKRIVSGSSDRTIRIWDPASRGEVARLEGHSNLVRTIQAAFADYPGGRRTLELEARQVERKFQEASMAGLLDPESGRKSRGTPGSRKPKDFKTVGAKIPPSGGGGRWGRIVSGSYDETIIIWKKTEDDEWVIGHRLRQEEALRASGPPLIPRSDPQAQAHATINLASQIFRNQQINQAGPVQGTIQAPVQAPFQAGGVQGPLPGGQVAPNPAEAAASALRNAPPVQPQPTTMSGPQNWNNPALARAYQQLIQGQQLGAAANPSHVTQANARIATRTLQAGQANQTAPVGQPNARVFKLQFDARRIVCCSQDPKIVGWDFANEDEQIIECSRFFAAPE